ncbi:hypothetical protein BP5796_09353 [Coleophoma crateriformis]|uniref:Zn(2)-C6 fungal-type domain-containing protein n=1 Tax=Coleophoma crateriformis TaxID=565419 RepID=A0A3D8QYH7_9HELO|nr:hypothetical protein BP5796_09353 [Coleophoma crateriformis]
MSPPNQPRLRARKPKTRTGCKTCKLRRVKCDDGKPFCARCLKFGVDCEGYEVGERPKTTTTHSSREILPKKYDPVATVLPSPMKPPFAAAFQDSRAYSYFLSFQDEAVIDIASEFDRHLWHGVILQASWNEPSLSQLVASLGAMYKAVGPKALHLSKGETQPHQQYAFQQYGRAIKGVQARISAVQHRDVTRIALIASLLIYCFENLYGELPSAIGHLEGALQLMQKQLAHARRRYKHSENRSPTLSVDDELVGAFFRLDSGLLSRDQISHAASSGSRLGMNFLENVLEVPRSFSTISEARSFLEHIQFPAIPSLSRDLISSPLLSCIDDTSREMYTTMSSQLHRWNIAFARLSAQTLTPHDKKGIVAIATLRVRALSTELAAQRVCATGLTSSCDFNPKSREIVDLSKLVIADPSFVKSFVWDCGIVPGLSIVMASCLDVSIQTEALQLLKQIVPRREGVWDSVTAVRFGEAVLQINSVD